MHGLMVQVMDTPRPEQVRAMQPGAEVATEEDCLEVSISRLGVMRIYRMLMAGMLAV